MELTIKDKLFSAIIYFFSVSLYILKNEAKRKRHINQDPKYKFCIPNSFPKAGMNNFEE